MADALILGCGYTGLRLGRRLRRAGHRVTGTSRSAERLDRLREDGIRPLRLDVSRRADVRRLEEEAADVCFYLIPPLRRGGSGAADREDDPGAGGGSDAADGGREGDDRDGGTASDDPRPDGPDARITAGDEIEAVIRALRRAPLEAFVYVSSTSVYGDRGGDPVDETAVPDPDSPAGAARLEAERTVLRCGWTWDCRPRIARVGGIYGPGRTLREAIAEGRYHLVEGLDARSNRIHVDDLAAGLVAVWERGENGRVYNLVDDEPHRSADFARRVAETAGLEIETLGAEVARERYSETRWARKAGSKRVSNRRLREELGVELEYPTWREGVPAALSAEGVEI